VNGIADDPTAGRFVRAPQLIEQEDSQAVPQESPAKSNKNKRKRKRDEEENNGNGQEKKLKEQASAAVENEVKEPVTYGNKLRESLKGSRFRFLNEQMYKQKGEIFKKDPTAFDAHEKVTAIKSHNG
jgi:ribosomal RNA-processing protein 8